jgi:hypothetical protein
MSHPDQPSTRSEAGAIRVQSAVREYDSSLSIFFYPHGGFYFLARPVKHSWEHEAGDLLKDDETVYSFAFRRGFLVVAQPADPGDLHPVGKRPHPLSVIGMESPDTALIGIRAHLRMNDIRPLAASHEERVKEVERKLDAADESDAKAVERRCRDEMKAFGRDFFRSRLLPRTFVPRGVE